MHVDLLKSKTKIKENLDGKLQQQISNFLENGFIVIPPNEKFLVNLEEAIIKINEFKTNNEEMISPFQDENGCLVRVVNLHEKVIELATLFSENSALELLDYFLGETTIYTSLFFEKGSSQDVHRDTPYFWTNPPYQYFGVWVALEETDSNNGPLVVVPGAHKLPEMDKLKIAKKHFSDLDKIDPYSQELWNDYQEQLKQQYQNAGMAEQEVHVNKGDTIIWHPQLPHGGAPILDANRTRVSFVMHVTPPNTAVYHQDIFFSDKNVPEKKMWNYHSINGRRYISHGHISFEHKKDYALAELI